MINFDKYNMILNALRIVRILKIKFVGSDFGSNEKKPLE
jgi:hypothetical protein